MTFEALLYECYARRGGGPLGAEVRSRGLVQLWNILDNLCSLLARGSNNKYSRKIIAKLIHFCEMYNK